MKGARAVLGSFAALSIGLLLAGCPAATSLIQLDQELSRTYAVQLEAARGSGDSFVMLSGVEGQLADLSRRAESQGDTVRARDAATAVAFYRIAAASAWKSGALRENDLLAIRDKGVEACEALPQRDASQPRDCTFIRLVPQLGLYDVKAREIARFATAATIPPGDLNRVVALIRDITGTAQVKGLLGELADVKAASASLPLGPSFDDYFRVNMQNEFCTVFGLAGKFFGSGVSDAQTDEVTDLVNAALAKLMAAEVPTTCVGGP